MAVTAYATNDPLAVKLWSKRLSVEALKQTQLSKFISTGTDNIIQVKDETSKGAGDQVTYGLRMQLRGSGVLGDGVLEGNEEALTTYSDALTINQLRHAVRSAGRMSQQRVPFVIRDEALSGLKDWWSDRFDQAGFNQLCGYIPQTDTRYTGNVATIAPDPAHYLNVANSLTTGSAAPANNDSDVAAITYTSAQPVNGSTTVSAAFSLEMIDRAKERAKTLTPAIRPVKIGGKDYYVMFLHPYQVTDLRRNTNPGQWLDIQKAAMTGGVVKDNPIFDGSLGIYNGVILHEDVRVTMGVSAAGVSIPTVRRAVFCGAQSMVIGFGRDGGPNRYTWVEELFDYENELGVSAGLIYGMKKTRFNNLDFGTITCSSYASQH